MFGFKVAVFIGAHPDDIELNAGGTLHKLVQSGVQAHSIILTSPSERLQEASRALRELGCEHSYHLQGVDRYLQGSIGSLIPQVDDILAEVKADVVFSHFHADTHQDHVAAYQVSVAAARRVPNFVMFKPTYPSGRPDVPFHPNLVSMLELDHIRAKLRALACHDSQKKRYGDDEWLKSVEHTAQGDSWTYGGRHGYAEVFQVSRLHL